MDRHVLDQLKKENGSGLVMALMTLFVLSILGTALMTLVVGSAQLTSVDGQSDATYYVAEAGLNRSYSEIELAVESIYESTNSEQEFYAEVDSLLTGSTGLNGVLFEDFQRNYGADPRAIIEVEGDDSGNPREYTIRSRGEIENLDCTLARDFTITYPEQSDGGNGGEELPIPEPPGNGGGSHPTGMAAVVNQQTNISAHSIVGDIFFDSTENGQLSFGQWEDPFSEGSTIYVPEGTDFDHIISHPAKSQNNSAYQGIHRRLRTVTYEAPWEYYYEIADGFPDIPSAEVPENVRVGNHNVIDNGNLNYNHHAPAQEGFVLEMDQDMQFDSINIGSHGSLRIDTNGQSVNLITNRLSVSGTGGLEVIGDGEVNLFVTESMNLADRSLGNENNVTALNVYYSGSQTVNIGGGFRLYSSLFIERADLEIGAGADAYGFIVSGGNNVRFTGGGHARAYVLAPRSHVFMSTNVTGMLIADELEISWATLTASNRSDLPPFTFAPHTGSTAPNLERVVELLTSNEVYGVN